MIATTVGVLLFIGMYTLLCARNLLRLLIGLEILVKAVTLVLFASAASVGAWGIAQAVFIAMLAVEVVVAVIVLALVMHVHGHHGSLDVRKLTELRG